jgi:hypothetical protein
MHDLLDLIPEIIFRLITEELTCPERSAAETKGQVERGQATGLPLGQDR